MASSTEAFKFPEYVFSEDLFCDLGILVREQMGNGMTLSSLCKQILQHRLEQHKLLEENSRHNKNSSLASISGARILDELNKSADIEADLRAVADTLTETTLQQLLRDPRALYHVLRAFHALPQSYITKEATSTGRRAVDIDEAVLENDRYIRFRGGLMNTDGKYLVGLKAFAGITADPNNPLTITRECPPKGGLELLDKYRQRTLRIQQNDDAYTKNFENITQGALRGLRWDNLIIAGSTALQALLDMDHTTHANDDDALVNDIGIFLYGLNANQANLKLRQIESLWKSNLDPNARVCVLRTESFVEFRVNRPYKSALVALTIFQSPTEILSHFHLDAYAIGYDGRQVLMLPRCARAIETGYSIFTTDLIMPRRLPLDSSSSRAMKDLFKHAHLGFGIRILPSHVKSLESSALEVASSAVAETGFGGNSSSASLRKPAEAREPGLKTLRRILLRAHFSMTARDEYSLDEPDMFSNSRSFDSFVTKCEFWRLCSSPLDAVDSNLTVDDVATSSRLHSEKLFNSLRHAIAREVGQQNMVAILAYRNYLTRRIRGTIYEETLGAALKRQISVPFIIPLDLEDYILHGIPQQHNDLPHLSMAYPPIIPVHDPTKYTQYTDLLLQETQHDPIPSIAEKADEGGNLRYRIITQHNMWAGQHPVLDEIAILLRILCQWFDHATSFGYFESLPEGFHTDSEAAIFHVAWSYKSLQLRAMGEANGELPYSSESMRTGRPAWTREYELFRQWVKQPDEEDGNYDGISSQRHVDSCSQTEGDESEWSKEGAPNPGWWTEGDEGEWDAAGTPPWTKWE